jgi:hypothetical protein
LIARITTYRKERRCEPHLSPIYHGEVESSFHHPGWWSVRFLRRSVRGEYQIGGPTLCASAPSGHSHARPPRRTRNSDRPRASDRTMVSTELNRLASFKNRRRCHHEKMNRGNGRAIQRRTLERSRAICKQWAGYRDKNFSATGRRRSFFVDIPFYQLSQNEIGSDKPCYRHYLESCR